MNERELQSMSGLLEDWPVWKRILYAPIVLVNLVLVLIEGRS